VERAPAKLSGPSTGCTTWCRPSGSPHPETVGGAHDWDRSKRRAFQNDALIALTARGHGATVVTANRGDFDILGKRLGVAILRVGPAA